MEDQAHHSFLRADLLRKVSHGELNPAEAETLAKEWKIEPLSARPHPSLFDPMTAAEWSLAMTLAWIVRRTPSAVRDNWNDYRQHCRDWHSLEWRTDQGETVRGYALMNRGPATFAGLIAAETTGRADDHAIPMMRAEDAFLELRVALEHGLMTATHSPGDDAGREPIPIRAWIGARISHKDGREAIASPTGSDGTPRRYFDVRFPPKAVTRIWPWPYHLAEPRRLPPLMTPEKPGYMPLFCAAQWIATEGGYLDFDPETVDAWRPAYRDLLGSIAAEQAKVVGLKDGLREPVPGYHFAGCKIDFPYQPATLEFLMTDELYLCSYPYIDENHWLDGFDDSLRTGRRILWARLMVANADILRVWPFHLGQPAAKIAPALTGAPGRPSSMHVVKMEYERRHRDGEAKPILSEEAESLRTWMKGAHAGMPTPTAKTIGNNLRQLHRKHYPPRN